MRTGRWVLAVLLLAAPFAVPAAGGEAGPSPSALRVFADLERFWSAGRADSILLRVCPEDIRLSFRRIGPRDGTFDHSQAEYLLRDLFTFTATDSFFLVRYEYDPEGGGPPEAVGHWYFQGARGVEREARVILELAPLNGAWGLRRIDAREW